MTFHVGIIGGGNISRTHLRAAREIDGMRVVAVCGENFDKVNQLAEACGAMAYGDLDAFLNHKPMEVVLIGSPSGLHAEQGIRAARRGIHVLVEKPIAITTAQADALIDECEKAGVKLGVFFQDRVAEGILKLKQWVDGGKLGKTFLASARVKWHRPLEYYRHSRWRGTWSLDGGGALMNQGVHTVDLLLWLMGDVRRVSAKAMTAIHDIEVEDTVVAMLEFASGAIGTFEATTSVYPGYPRRLEVTGTEGTVIIESDRIVSADLRVTLDDTENEQPSRDDERATSPVISDASGHRRLIEDFLHAIVADTQPVCDGREARRSVELVQAIYESSRIGQPISLDEND